MTPEEAKARIHDIVCAVEPREPPAILLRHPINGALFVDGECRRHRDYEKARTFPPQPPGSERFVEYDEAEVAVYVPWEPGEREAAQAAYEEASRQWHATSGLVIIPGPETCEATLRTEDGAHATFVRGPNGVWLLIEASGP